MVKLRNGIYFRKDLDLQFSRYPLVTKFSYLLECLQGEALDIVVGLAFVNQNYEIDIKILTKRYGFQDVMVKILQNELQGLECINFVKNLNVFLLELELILMQLENIGESINNRETYLNLLKKLPNWLIKEIINE